MTVKLKKYFPLPFKCEHQKYFEAGRDAHRNPIKDWKPGVEMNCTWYSPSAFETPHEPVGGDRVRVDYVLGIADEEVIDHRDRFVINGHLCEVIGLPHDYNHGPYGLAPGRLILELQWIG